MLSSAADSAGIDLLFAAALMESETTQLAPAIAMLIALPFMADALHANFLRITAHITSG